MSFCRWKPSWEFAIQSTPFIPSMLPSNQSSLLDRRTCFIPFQRPKRGLRLIANRISGPGVLTFTAHEDIQVHIHAGNEVPYTSEGGIKENVYYGSVKEVILSVTEMVNDGSVEDISIQNRRCRFPWELPESPIPHHYNYYSHSTCMVECSIAIQVKYCNCTHHLMPRNNGWC